MKKTLVVWALAVLPCAHAQLRYAGSDTVEPLVEAARVAYLRAHPGFKLTISSVGSSSGLRELCTGRSFFVGASRPIKPDETKECAAAGVTATEIPVAIDALVLITSPKLPAVGVLSMAEVKRIFSPSSSGTVVNWRQIRPDLPDAPLATSGVDIKHGTFEFFHGAIGNGKFVRSDMKATTHHDETAKFVETNAGALGYVPLAVAQEWGARVRIVPINFGRGPVMPDLAAVRSGSYAPLTRTVYVYVNGQAVSKSEADAAFIRYFANGLEKFSAFAGLIPLSSDQQQETIRRASLPVR